MSRDSDERFVIELTKGEVILLQNQINFDGGYQWEKDIVDVLVNKLQGLYERPTMTEKELDERIEEYKEELGKRYPDRNPGIMRYVEAAERGYLGFYNKIIDNKSEKPEKRVKRGR